MWKLVVGASGGNEDLIRVSVPRDDRPDVLVLTVLFAGQQDLESFVVSFGADDRDLVGLVRTDTFEADIFSVRLIGWLGVFIISDTTF